MERRRELRLKFDESVRVTALGANPFDMPGKAVDLSGRGISIFVRASLTPGDPVKIHLEDALMLGEVCYSRAHNEGYVIGVQIDQVLNGLTELERLNRALLLQSEDEGVRHDSRALSYSLSEQA